ncbi:type IV pilin-like G/H family protein [Pseudanabaena sp. PCC 6802]|uniref:type IV pilin-like G/H family protein n=1 Tax=Pseudanabaena sp. PCC 6802 TaxID=118173 RepID=UPI0003488E47|nr:type IV pilin-like G/H family protein [Pseudanabaena sp. PCC 6802]
MKSEFRAKLLQHVLSKKNSEKGFTLIELLVVIIIIGILAAIALPSFLNQSNKAKQSEAKTYVGTLNKGQQAYFTEKNRFGSDINILGVGVKTQTENYDFNSANAAYDAGLPSNNNATSTGTPRSVALRGYSGMVQLNVVASTSDVTSLAALCEMNQAGATTPVSPTSNATGGPTCTAGTQPVGN